jgi:hypothetical protein
MQSTESIPCAIVDVNPPRHLPSPTQEQDRPILSHQASDNLQPSSARVFHLSPLLRLPLCRSTPSQVASPSSSSTTVSNPSSAPLTDCPSSAPPHVRHMMTCLVRGVPRPNSALTMWDVIRRSCCARRRGKEAGCCHGRESRRTL